MEEVSKIGEKAIAGIAENPGTELSSAGTPRAERGANQGRQAPKGAKTRAKEKP